MKRLLLLIVHLFILSATYGQTIIDLKPGGGIRSKTVDEYRKEEPGLAEKLKADSVQYNENLTRALNALYRDSIDQAEVLLEEALKLRPNAAPNQIIRLYLGKIAMAKGDFRKGIQIFNTLLKDQPNNREVRFNRATCFLEIRNTKAALEDCHIILAEELSETERIKTLFLRSACHTEDRHPEKAKTDLEEILRLAPDNESAQLLLAFSYKHLGQPMEALNRMNLFVTSHPKSIEGLIARAELEEQLKMNETARADYDEAIRLAPNDASLYAKRGKLLMKLELPQQGLRDLRKAIQLGHPSESLLPYFPKNED